MRYMALSVLCAGAVMGLSDFGKAIIEEAYCHRASIRYSNSCDISLNSAAMEFVSLQRLLLQLLFCSSGMVPVRGFPFLSFGKVCF